MNELNSLDDIRKQIDRVDRELVRLVAEQEGTDAAIVEAIYRTMAACFIEQEKRAPGLVE